MEKQNEALGHLMEDIALAEGDGRSPASWRSIVQRIEAIGPEAPSVSTVANWGRGFSIFGRREARMIARTFGAFARRAYEVAGVDPDVEIMLDRTEMMLTRIVNLSKTRGVPIDRLVNDVLDALATVADKVLKTDWDGGATGP